MKMIDFLMALLTMHCPMAQIVGEILAEQTNDPHGWSPTVQLEQAPILPNPSVNKQTDSAAIGSYE
jgi:hypothetical protein